MALGTVILAVGNAVAAAILINSGIVKLVTPDRLPRALREVAPSFGDLIGRGAGRLTAAVELAAALGLLVAATRPAAAVVVGALGASFAALGTAGWLRGSTSPCGCFGQASDRPLGPANIAIGLALVLLAWSSSRAGAGADDTTAAVLLTSIGAVLVCLWTNRRLAVRLVWRPRSAAPAPREVR